MISRWLLFMSSALVVLSMQGAMAQVTTGTITGVVVARDGGQPVIDATVAVEGTNLTAVANGVGRFRLEGVPPGQVVIVATGPGFLQLRVPDVRVTSNDAISLIVELEHTPNIMERVQVTATKTELSIGDVAAQTDIVTRSTIDDRNHQSLSTSPSPMCLVPLSPHSSACSNRCSCAACLETATSSRTRCC